MMLMRKKRLRKQAGDTIVEVLIAMSIVSLGLAGAYVATNRNVSSTRDTQEHGQALKIIETQIEFLRAAAVPSIAAGTTYTLPAGTICFNPTGGTETVVANCTVDAGGTPTTDQPAFKVSITPPPTTADAYTLTVKWTSLHANSDVDDANITMVYRPN